MSGARTITRRLRWSDFDMLGHLNQAVYHVLLEDSRVAVLREVWGDRIDLVVARAEVDFRAEVAVPTEEVQIEVAVESVGRSSFVVLATIRDGERVCAESRTVIVGWNPEARGSRPLTAAERAGLESLTVAPATT